PYCLARLRIRDRDPGTKIRRPRLNDDLAAKASDLIHLFHHGDTFDEIAELHDSAHLSEDRLSKLVPFGDRGPGFNPIALFHLDDSAIEQSMMLSLATRVIDDHKFAVSVHDHRLTILSRDEIRPANTDGALMAKLQLVGFNLTTSCRTTDVEGTHGELSTGLTDGLRRNDAHGLTHVHHVSSSQIAPVTHGTDATTRLTGKHRTNHDLFDPSVLDTADMCLFKHAVGGDNDITSERINDLLKGHTTQDPIAQGLNDFTAFFKLGNSNPVEGTAIKGTNHAILGYVHKTSRQIPRVCSLERRIRQALTSAVG